MSTYIVLSHKRIAHKCDFLIFKLLLIYTIEQRNANRSINHAFTSRFLFAFVFYISVQCFLFLIEHAYRNLFGPTTGLYDSSPNSNSHRFYIPCNKAIRQFGVNIQHNFYFANLNLIYN